MKNPFLTPGILAIAAIGLTFGVAGCLGAPEQCHACLIALEDAGIGVFDARTTFDMRSSDGAGASTGGITGSGGQGGEGAGAGGGQGGGAAGQTGMGTGGDAPDGTGAVGANTGGAGVGGTGSAGIATGGTGVAGGAASGGSASGGRGTGGASSSGGAGSMAGTGTGGTISSTGGTASSSGGAVASSDSDLVLWYRMDESSGTTAADSAAFGGTARNGTLKSAGSGSAAFSSTKQVGSHSLNLSGSSSSNGGYVTVPSPGLQSLAPRATTIACWVFVRSNQAWQRAFDFGVSTSGGYMFLTTNQTMTTPSSVRFAITTTGYSMEEAINMTAPSTLSLNTWHHLAVVLEDGASYKGSLYIDGAVAGTNPAMTLHAIDLGATANNFLGKSAFSDAYFNGLIDDFRIYDRALTAAEISAIFAIR